MARDTDRPYSSQALPDPNFLRSLQEEKTLFTGSWDDLKAGGLELVVKREKDGNNNTHLSLWVAGHRMAWFPVLREYDEVDPLAPPAPEAPGHPDQPEQPSDPVPDPGGNDDPAPTDPIPMPDPDPSPQPAPTPDTPPTPSPTVWGYKNLEVANWPIPGGPVSANPNTYVLKDSRHIDRDTIQLMFEIESGNTTYAQTWAPNTPTPSTTTGDWAVAGKTISNVWRWSRVRAQGLSYPWYFPERMRHYIYIKLSVDLVDATTYTITTPWGATVSYTHDVDATTDLFKVAHSYAPVGPNKRVAIMALWRGDGGSREFAGAELTVNLRVTSSGALDSTPTVTAKGFENNSGEYVYSIDLSSPAGGEGQYYLEVADLGCRSRDFWIGGTKAQGGYDWMAWHIFRGLYHQRCGYELKQPFTAHEKEACHLRVMKVDGVDKNGGITGEIPQTLQGPVMQIKGGYHDAGDYDQRFHHLHIPLKLLWALEAFPAINTATFDIPATYGLPHVLEEALWGIENWRWLQDSDGGVRAGRNAHRHPNYGMHASHTEQPLTQMAPTQNVVDGQQYTALNHPCGKDWSNTFRCVPNSPEMWTMPYRTYKKDVYTTIHAAAAFAWAARMIKVYRSGSDLQDYIDDLTARAQSAYEWAQESGETIKDGGLLCAAANLHLLTGIADYKTVAEAAAVRLKAWVSGQTYGTLYFNSGTLRAGQLFAEHLVPFMMNDATATNGFDNTKREDLFNALIVRGGLNQNDLSQNYRYPIRNHRLLSWGGSTDGGRGAEPYLFAHAWDNALSAGMGAGARVPSVTSGRADLLDQAAACMQFHVGVNPMGKSFVTGMGHDPPCYITDNDSFHWIRKFKNEVTGPKPGINIYGITNGLNSGSVARRVIDRHYPSLETIPGWRRWAGEGHGAIIGCEWTPVETQMFTVTAHVILAHGV